MSVIGLRETFQSITGADFTGALKRGGVALALAAASIFTPGIGDAGTAGTGPRLHESHTQQSGNLADLQRFNAEARGVIIVPMDPDWFQLNAALNDKSVFDPLMTQFTHSYVKKKSGVDLVGSAHYAQIRRTLALGLNNTYSIHILSEQDGKRKVTAKICMLFPPSADDDRKSDVKHYLLGIRPLIHTGIASLPLNKNIRPHLQEKYDNYHEFGHCFDRWYVEESLTTQEQGKQKTIPPAAHMIRAHKVEVFSEVMGGLLMARDGITDIIPERSDIRLSGNAIIGPVAYRLRSNNPLPGGANTGFVYAFYRALEATQKKIDELGDSIRAMPIDELASVAHELTEANALGENEALGAMFLWHDLYDMNKLNELAPLRLEARRISFDYQKVYSFVQEFRNKMNDALSRVLDFGDRTQGIDPLDLIDFRFDDERVYQSDPGFGVEDTTPVYMIRDELQKRADASGDRTPESLIRSYEQYKDERRAVLEAGPEKQRREARSDLSVAPEALRLAVRELDRATAPVIAAPLSPGIP